MAYWWWGSVRLVPIGTVGRQKREGGRAYSSCIGRRVPLLGRRLVRIWHGVPGFETASAGISGA